MKAKAVLGADTLELATPLVSDKMPDATTRKGVVAWRFPRWSLTKETKREKDADGRTYQTRMMVPLAWVSEQTGLYEGLDFSDPSKKRNYITPDIDGEFDLNISPARLGINTNWIPAIENKGEGLFLQFNKTAVDL